MTDIERKNIKIDFLKPNYEIDEEKKTINRKECVRFDSKSTWLTTDSEDVREKIQLEIKNVCRLTDKERADRLFQPRMSLLGKPLNYNRGSRRDARYRRLQSRAYNFLERPRGLPAILYHIMVFLMVFACLTLSVFSTIKEYEEDAIIILFRMEILVVIWFTVEFILRLWSSGCRSRYQGAIGRLKFLKRPFCIIDIITIAASLVVLGMGTSGQVFATSALRGLRFFQILRMVRMDRRGGTWKLLGSVVYAHRQELITTMYIGFLGLIFASFLVYLMEKDVNEKFNNFAQALWWGVITLCTVGYGDMVPETWQGKLIASFCALLGISFFALPAGILGSGFALKVQQQQRQKHMIRRRQPAATLIQSLWRCYAADEQSISVATWKIHQVPLPSPPHSYRTNRISLIRRASSSFKHNASFVARLPTIRRHKSQSLHSHNNTKLSIGRTGSARCTRNINELNTSVENLEVTKNEKSNPCVNEDSFADAYISKKNSEDEDDELRCVQLTTQHKTAIRFVRKMKYFVARRKFKEALKPYDVKDVMEQYAAGHVDLLGRVKNVQTRLDQILGKQGSKAKDVYASKISLASRIVKVERQVVDIEEKLDILIEAYMQDRQRFLAFQSVPNTQHSNSFVNKNNDSKSGKTVPILSTNNSSSFKIKSIAMKKQSSEPNSPISKSFNQKTDKRHPFHQGHFGSRLKKNVTLGSIEPKYSKQSNGQTDKTENVVIIVPDSENDSLKSVIIQEIPGDVIYINNDQEIEQNSQKTTTNSSIILMDHNEDDIQDNKLNYEHQMDIESPTWNAYNEDNMIANIDEYTEDTALLGIAANTVIKVTSLQDFSGNENDRKYSNKKENINTMASLDPESHSKERLLTPSESSI